MKARDIPKSGRDGSVVHCHLGNTAYVRRHIKAEDPNSDAQRRVRDNLKAVTKAYGGWLTEPERQVWDAVAQSIQSRPRLGQSGPLTGEVLFSKLNCVRALIGREWLRLPSEPAVFGPCPVGDLTLRRAEGRLRLELAVTGPVTDELMVYATPPCPPTWRKCRKARYLGLLPAPVNGVSDITDLYLARFDQPTPGQRIFIRTVQQRDGWKGEPVDTSNLVPTESLAVATTRPNAGASQGEPRTPNVQPRTLNQASIGAWRLRFGACLELGCWNLELPPPPCPGEMVAVHRLFASLPAAQSRPPPGRTRASAWLGRGVGAYFG